MKDKPDFGDWHPSSIIHVSLFTWMGLERAMGPYMVLHLGLHLGNGYNPPGF